MREADDPRARIRSLLESAAGTNDNFPPPHRVIPRLPTIIGVIAATLVLAGAIGVGVAVIDRGPRVTLAASGGSLAVIGPVTVNRDRTDLAAAWGMTPPASAADRFDAWLARAEPEIRSELGPSADSFITTLQADDDDR